MSHKACEDYIREGAFLHDFEAFLDYLQREKVKVTPKLELIPLKHCRKITALFRQPDPLELKFRKRVYRCRSEFQLPRLFFIDLLAVCSGCAEITSKGHYRKGQQLPYFRRADPRQKVGGLFISWWHNVPWENLLSYGDEFAKLLQDNRAALIPVLRRTVCNPVVEFKQFADEVLEATGARWICEAGDPDNRNARWGVERIIIRTLEYFEAVERIEEVGDYGIKETAAFSLKTPLAELLISLLSISPTPLVAS